jgi:hypothetical protein
LVSNANVTGALQNVNIHALKRNQFTIPLLFIYKPVKSNDIFLQQIKDILLSPHKVSKFKYVVRIKVPLISWTGYKIEVGDFLKYNVLESAGVDKDNLVGILKSIVDNMTKN